MSEEKMWDQAEKTQQATDELASKLKAVEVAVHKLVAAVESGRKDGSIPSVVLYETSAKAVELGWELDALECDEDESSVDWDDDDEDDEDFDDSPLGWSDGDDDWDDDDFDDFDDDEWNESEWDEDDEDDDDDGDAGLSSNVIAPEGTSGQSRIVNLCEDDVRKFGGLAS